MPAKKKQSAPTSTSGSPAPIRLADVAREVGLSRSGVSRALRNDPSIPLATCREVQKVARKLGFVVDHKITRAFQLVRRSTGTVTAGTLGLIDAWPAANHWRDRPDSYTARIHAAAAERARELGYKLDVFSLHEPGMSARRLQSILDARQVAGLIVPPMPDETPALPIRWEKYPCVALTHSLHHPALHRVVPHQFQAASLALHHLQLGGYRRIGFLTWEDIDVRVNHHFRAAYLAYQSTIPPEDRLPMLAPHGETDNLLAAWIAQHRPDAILATLSGFVELLERCGFHDFPRVGFVSLGGAFVHPGHPLHHQVAHVNQNVALVGRSGVDQLVAQIDRREHGVPTVANVLMVEGTWVPGATVRPDLSSKVRTREVG
jgi:LacI family transcriptional regulator